LTITCASKGMYPLKTEEGIQPCPLPKDNDQHLSIMEGWLFVCHVMISQTRAPLTPQLVIFESPQ
jgi:hypothetical protein